MKRLSRTTRRPGFSLVELVVTMPLAALLMMGLASAIHLAARATPDEASPASESLAMHAALDRLTWELRHANSIVKRTTFEIVFQTPDRDADSADELLHYYWSGVAGTPLLRRRNAGAVEEIATNIGQFELAFATRASLEGSTTVYRLRRVDVVLRKAKDGRALVAAVGTKNEPQVAGP
jgi:hypothetical protein